MKSDTAYLHHIRDAVRLIRTWTGDRSAALLVQEPDELVRAGVVRQLEIIGEAARMLSDEAKVQEKDVPWRDIADTRNKLIQEYFGVDYEQVLVVVQEELEPLDSAVARLLNSSR
jgi:uncharacterized protein with HEPN domain